MAEPLSPDEDEHGGGAASSSTAASAPSVFGSSTPQVAHPFVSDDDYRRFVDELDWGLA